MKKSLLLVVDVQNGFVVNEPTKAVIEPINRLIDEWRARGWPVVFSRFINQPNSPWINWLGYEGMMTESETALHNELNTDHGQVFDKSTYSAWSPEVAQIYEEANCQAMTICGIDTDQCVLATAIEVFDNGIMPILVRDACASSAELKFHEAGLLLLERLIGRDQIIKLADIHG